MRKKSGRRASAVFKKRVEDIDAFLDQENLSSFSDAHVTWVHDHAIIRLHREFEDMILNCLVAAINSDTQSRHSRRSCPPITTL